MAQLWLTYDEIADTFGCRPDVASDAVRSRGWTRKRSQDSQIRVLLPQDVMQAYVLKVAATLQAKVVAEPLAAPVSLAPAPASGLRQAA